MLLQKGLELFMEINEYEMPKVSIIIACYNTEQYVQKCIDSILNNDYPNMELIIINDGSTDNTAKVLEFYKAYSNIVIITQRNKGLSAALNKGIEIATGKYIQIVDSDDWISPDLISKSVKEAEKTNADIVYTAHCIAIEEDNTIKYEKKPIIKSKCNSNQEIIDELFNDIIGISDKKIYEWGRTGVLKRQSIPGYNTSRLYKREIIIKNGIRFDECIKMKMDCIFNLNYFVYAQKTSYVEGPEYFYRIRFDRSNSVAQIYKDDVSMYNNKLALLNARNFLRVKLLREKKIDIISTYCGSIVLSAVEIALCCARDPKKLGYRKFRNYMKSGVKDCVKCLSVQLCNPKFNLLLTMFKLHFSTVVYIIMKILVALRLDKKISEF